MRGHLTTSALVLDPTLTRALVIHHRVFDVWLQPGGHYEPPGSLWDSACREVREETGVDAMTPFPSTVAAALLDIDTHPIPARAAKGEGSPSAPRLRLPRDRAARVRAHAAGRGGARRAMGRARGLDRLPERPAAPPGREGGGRRHGVQRRSTSRLIFELVDVPV